MRKLALALVVITLAGCGGFHTYTEGTGLQLGAYIPYDGGIAGVQVVQYLNGCALRAHTNANFNIHRQFSTSNTYFGVVHTIEHSDTDIEVYHNSTQLPAKEKQ